MRLNNFLEVLTNPNKFFEKRYTEEISLKIPFLIVIIYAAISGTFAYFFTKGVMEPGAVIFGPEIVKINILLAVIVGIILPFIIWFGFTLVFHLASFLFKREYEFNSTPLKIAGATLFGAIIGAFIGDLISWARIGAFLGGIVVVSAVLVYFESEFKRTLEFVSFGLIPLMISGVIRLIVTVFYVLPKMTKIYISVETPDVMRDAMMADPLMFASSVLGIALIFWSMFIWISGVKHSRNLSLKNALLLVGIPTGVYICYRLANLF